MRRSCVCGATRVALLIAMFAAAAHAHKPVSIGGTYRDILDALPLTDIDVSQVVYAELTAEEPELWLTFTNDEPAEVYVSLGVPVLDRLVGYRPWIAVLGPGLPNVDVPVAVPEGYGGFAFQGRPPTEDDLFYEPFTGTESWITAEETVPLLEKGRHFIVAWAPEEAGKLWVAVGVREQFALRDVLSLPATVRDVRAFHEVADRAARIRWERILVWAVIGAIVGWTVLRSGT
jgi:hypothetical protein